MKVERLISVFCHHQLRLNASWFPAIYAASSFTASYHCLLSTLLILAFTFLLELFLKNTNNSRANGEVRSQDRSGMCTINFCSHSCCVILLFYFISSSISHTTNNIIIFIYSPAPAVVVLLLSSLAYALTLIMPFGEFSSSSLTPPLMLFTRSLFEYV